MAGFYNIPGYPYQQQWNQYNRPIVNRPVYQQYQNMPVFNQPQQQRFNYPVQQQYPQRVLPPTQQISKTPKPAALPPEYQWLTKPVKSNYPLPQVNISPFQQPANQINKLLATSIKPVAGPDNSMVPKFPFKNDLKQLMKDNKAIIEAIVIRTFGARDKNNDGIIEKNKNESGTFLNAINRLDELKALGINTLHVLPVSEVGKINKLGEAGSIYAPADYNQIASELDTPNNALSVRDEMKIFVNECHKRGIRVMVDLPSCGSIDMTKTHPDWFLRDRDGNLKVPGTWQDIRMFDPYVNRDTGELRQSLLEMHKEFVQKMIDLGVDGIRADVARAKPAHFWKELIEFSHKLDPNFGWLAESYVHEDASPMANIPADRPEELLQTGFDSFYGQYHTLHNMKNATDINKYVIDNLEMTQRLPKGKSMIGSFYTHDDKSVMEHGGTLYCQFASALVSTLPMVNPYYINGFETGDTKQMDIFNYVKPPKGEHPELFNFISGLNKMRDQYNDVIGKGYYIPLKVKGPDKDDKIMAFARHYNGKTLLVILNKDINARHIGRIEVPTLSAYQYIQDLVPYYGAKSKLAIQDNSIAVDLAPGRVHVFEINTPDILRNVKDIYRQNL